MGFKKENSPQSCHREGARGGGEYKEKSSSNLVHHHTAYCTPQYLYSTCTYSSTCIKDITRINVNADFVLSLMTKVNNKCRVSSVYTYRTTIIYRSKHSVGIDVSLWPYCNSSHNPVTSFSCALPGPQVL